ACDGRGVVVAVFDTGVDPGAAGLLTTSHGKPKIIDIVDGTGSGDVVMEHIPKPQGNTIVGLTGRTLKLNPKWKNPTGEFRIGWKPASELFPRSLAARMKRERKRAFDRAHRKIEIRLRRKIADWSAAHPSPSAKHRQQKQELQGQLERLQAEANPADPGSVFDCVVFHDGKHWRAVVDTDEDGDLGDEIALTNYRAERKYATFGKGAGLNFSVNIYENGKRLSIVCAAGAHGTHVSGIIAAHYPDQPELNGIAPGAQIVSVKIGDTRLGAMETGAGLVRGLRTVIENKCDLINMSYGEATSIPNRGRLIALLSDVVRKQGVIFVASAGNEGPALSTVGSPGGTSSEIIGVGAYISPQMMAVEYTLRKKLPGLPYTWTSRGPASDGDTGVNIFAPGGAISPVPQWTLQKSVRMNGTSMASPNCCGGLALLLSALKAQKITYSPSSIRRAIANTARRIDSADVFAQGPGLLQVDRALSYLQKNEKQIGEQLQFDVRVSGGKTTRGIYLRSARESSQPMVATVSIKPVFPQNAKPNAKTKFELRFSLQATKEWVETGKFALMTHGGVRISVRVDPTKLAPGAHFAEVHGFDANNSERGPIFRVPITVLKPTPMTARNENGCAYNEKGLAFAAGRLHRRFIVVPEGAEWADLSLRVTTPGKQPRRFVVHTLKALPGRSIDDVAVRKYVTLQHGRQQVHSISVRGGRMMELCLAQYWSSLGKSELSFELNFRGLRPDCRTLSLSPGTPTARVAVTALTGRERLSPSAVLKTHRTFHPPQSAV
ncbi:MAG: S8 family serine peptidase, partial [Planctomycetes bacterium]|nr:S8 family serine peptidase [Planctomycetota bacterium]